MSYPVFAYGHDFGNSEVCGVLVGPNQYIERRIPSVTAIGSWDGVVSMAKGSGNDTVEVPISHYILEYDTVIDGEARHIEKYVGQKVYDAGMDPLQTIGDRKRYWVNGYNLEMLKVGVASIVPFREFGVHVCTGLPIDVYMDDPTNIDLVREALLGTHSFYLNGVERIMHVESVKVIMEGAGALIAYGSNADVLQGVIDIGGQTTDLFAAKGQKPRQALCTGFKKGVAAAEERLAEKFRQYYGQTPLLETRKGLLHEHVNGRPYRVVRDKNHNTIADDFLKEMIETSLREVGQEIATDVARAWDRYLPDFDTILVVGGGAFYFTQDIQKRIGYAKKANKPGMANAEGYVRLAEVAMKRAQVAERR